LKIRLYSIILFALFFVFITSTASAYTFDWKGTSTTWASSSSWTRSGSGGTSTYPGQSGSVDIVRIGVSSYSGSQPTLSSSVTVASVEFGDNSGNAMTLTVNSGVTLTVTGSVTQDHNNSNGGITTTLSGSGTAALICSSMNIGDNTAPPVPNGDYWFGGNLPTMNTTTFNCNIPTLTVSGNLTLNSTSTPLTTWYLFFFAWAQNYSVNNPVFNLNSGTLAVNNIITTNSAYVSRNDGTFNIYNTCAYNMDLGSSTNALYLMGSTPLTAATGGTFDFASSSGTTSASTVYYAAASGTQTVYNSNDSYVGNTPTVYPNLVFSGASSKTIDGGSLTVGGNWTTGGGSVNMNTNNPSATISGNWTNATTVTEGTGNVSVSGTLTVNSGAVINGSTSSGTTTVTGTTSNSGNINENAENMTFTGAFTNSNSYTAGSGTSTFSSSFTNNSATFSCGSGSVYFNSSYTNSAGSTFNPGTGTVYFNYAGAQTLTDNSTTGTVFNNVNFQNSGTKTLTGSGSFYVNNTGVLTMAGTTTLSANGLLTLNSGATSSATVAAIPSSCSITGNVNVQRYITGGSLSYRGYRLLSSAVTNGTDTHGNPVYSINYLKNYIYLTGTTTTGGFDNTSPANPTLYLFRENMTPAYTTFLNSCFRGINNINSSPSYTLDVDGSGFYILQGNGFLCWFRGNRASASYATETVTTYVPQPVTLSSTGTLNQGTINVYDWFTPTNSKLSFTGVSPVSVQGFNLVGNPYASTIDWETLGTGIIGAHISNTIYELDPVSHNFGTYTLGGFPAPTLNASRYIVSGQAFMVIATSAAAKLSFNENAKTNTQVVTPQLLMGAPVAQNITHRYLRLKLTKDTVNRDESTIVFSTGVSTKYSLEKDAPYRQGMGLVSLSSMSSDKVNLAINTQPLPKSSESIALSVSATTDGTYSLRLDDIAGIPQLYDIWLKDAYRKDSVNMRQKPTYSFDVVRSDTNTFGSKRFSLVMSQNPDHAYQLLSFNASKVTGTPANPKQVQVVWTAKNEENYTNFAVERSTDTGKTYQVIGSLTSSGQSSYSLVDRNPADQNIYRLQQQDIDDSVTYSKAVKISFSNLSGNLMASNISVYPNPVKSTLNLTITTEKPAYLYCIEISNSTGLVVKQVTSSQPSWQSSVNDLLPGIYIVKVLNYKDNSLIGNTKFVKL
jgi:hypothetical protein